MHLSNESILVILFVGIVAGWLAGRMMEGGGFGLIGDLIVGLIGAFIGDWLLPQLGLHLGTGILSLILNAFIGAVVLLLLLRLVGGGWGRRRWGRWYFYCDLTSEGRPLRPFRSLRSSVLPRGRFLPGCGRAFPRPGSIRSAPRPQSSRRRG
jgi:uncharacterized membrane protein YeaQ/YmgE (transglycosylase-associated protein family)